MKNVKKLGAFQFIIGFLMGAIIFSGTYVYATELTAKSTSAIVVVNSSKETTLKGYTINGENYFRLEDIAKAANFSLTYDSINKKSFINTKKKYTANETLTGGYGTVSKTTKAGNVISTTDGKYTITKGKTDKEAALPEWQPEWNSYPRVKIPSVTPVRYSGATHAYKYDSMLVLNEYEIERMIRTIYKYAKQNPYLWENSDPSTNNPNFSIKVVYEEDMAYNTFYPWRDWEIEKQVINLADNAELRIYVVDKYNNGEFIGTEYYMK